MNVNSNEILEIIKGCISNKRKQQEQLFKKYYGILLPICRRYTKDDCNAQEMIQKSFIKIYKNIYTFNNSGSFEGWIKRIVVNSCIDHIRINSKLKANIVFNNSIELDIYDDDKEEEINVDYLYNIKYKDVEKAINLLSPQFRNVFNLYLIENFSHHEIAKILNISYNTSKANLSKAKARIRKTLNHNNF